MAVHGSGGIIPCRQILPSWHNKIVNMTLPRSPPVLESSLGPQQARLIQENK